MLGAWLIVAPVVFQTQGQAAHSDHILGALVVTVAIIADREWFVRDSQAPHMAREEWTVKFPPSVVSDFDPLLDRTVKIVAHADDLDGVARCETSMHTAAGEQVTAARSQPCYFGRHSSESQQGREGD